MNLAPSLLLEWGLTGCAQVNLNMPEPLQVDVKMKVDVENKRRAFLNEVEDKPVAGYAKEFAKMAREGSYLGGMDPEGRWKMEEEIGGSFTFTCKNDYARSRKGKRNRKREILEWSKIP